MYVPHAIPDTEPTLHLENDWRVESSEWNFYCAHAIWQKIILQI